MIGAIIFGGQFDADNPLLKLVVEFTEKLSRFVRIGSALDFLPFGSLIMYRQIKKFEADIQPLNEFTYAAIR